jgi:hypothetical protein
MGESYDPVAILGCENTVALMQYIWNNRQQPFREILSSTKQLPQYKALKQKTFSAAADRIVDLELCQMIECARQNINYPPYDVFDAADEGAEPQMCVGYKRLGGMTAHVRYGEVNVSC